MDKLFDKLHQFLDEDFDEEFLELLVFTGVALVTFAGILGRVVQTIRRGVAEDD